METVPLAIYKCPKHGFMSICIQDEYGATRITPSKCCGSWVVIKQWNVSISDILSAIDSHQFHRNNKGES